MLRLVLEYWGKGGVINALIFVVCCVVVFIGLGKLWQYRRFRRMRSRVVPLLDHGAASPDGLRRAGDWFTHDLVASSATRVRPPSYYQNRLRELLLEHVPRLEAGLDTMAAWIGVAPLLGLLGTVVGMIKTFDIIMEFGVGNPSLLSEGISVSLLTTQAGLLVAFPCLLFHNVLQDMKSGVVKQLVADGERAITRMCEEGARG